uniref:Uncharacterized protein n=1 Tax=Anopheles atroparvus TaxID=41427 RepID=A0AAG5DUI6_ANOAO
VRNGFSFTPVPLSFEPPSTEHCISTFRVHKRIFNHHHPVSGRGEAGVRRKEDSEIKAHLKATPYSYTHHTRTISCNSEDDAVPDRCQHALDGGGLGRFDAGLQSGPVRGERVPSGAALIAHQTPTLHPVRFRLSAPQMAPGEEEAEEQRDVNLG